MPNARVAPNAASGSREASLQPAAAPSHAAAPLNSRCTPALASLPPPPPSHTPHHHAPRCAAPPRSPLNFFSSSRTRRCWILWYALSRRYGTRIRMALRDAEMSTSCAPAIHRSRRSPFSSALVASRSNRACGTSTMGGANKSIRLVHGRPAGRPGWQQLRVAAEALAGAAALTRGWPAV
jgi:hypothetical protein